MENIPMLPVDLSDRILEHQVCIDIGEISEEGIAETVQLYVEAISFYTNIVNDGKGKEGLEVGAYEKRSQFFRQKIKRLMTRSDVQHFLLGRSNYLYSFNLQKELEMVKKHAPEQARVLASRYNAQKVQQERMIKLTLKEQNLNLMQKIERRSRSKNRKGARLPEMNLPAVSKISSIAVTF